MLQSTLRLLLLAEQLDVSRPYVERDTRVLGELSAEVQCLQHMPKSVVYTLQPQQRIHQAHTISTPLRCSPSFS